MNRVTYRIAAITAVMITAALAACEAQQEPAPEETWTNVTNLNTIAGTWSGTKPIELFESLGGVAGTRSSSGNYNVTLTVNAGDPNVTVTERMDFEKFLDDFFSGTKDAAWGNVKNNIKPPSGVTSNNYFLTITHTGISVAELFAGNLPTDNLLVNDDGTKLKVNVTDKLGLIQDNDVDLTLLKA